MRMKQIKVSPAVYRQLQEHQAEMESKLERKVTFSEVVEDYQSKVWVWKKY